MNQILLLILGGFTVGTGVLLKSLIRENRRNVEALGDKMAIELEKVAKRIASVKPTIVVHQPVKSHQEPVLAQPAPKPVGEYLNYLRYARDKFADKPEEKVILNGIISKVEQQYEHSTNATR